MNIKRLRNKVIPFHFQPFSKKQMKILTWWTKNSPYKDYDAIIADGAVRSGKTVSLAMSFVMWAMESFNGENFALCGKTIYQCRRNVVTPLKQMLKSRGYKIHDALSENILIIQLTKMEGDKKVTTVNYFHIFGGSNEASQDLIQGITLAGVFFDEVALMPESFVNQATARCSVDGAKFWFSCNPDQPFHWFKQEWINKAAEKKVLYLHFTMLDNPSMTEKVRQRYEALYTGVFYKRFILGLWVLADGVVYPMFDADVHCIDYDRPWTRVFIAGDFGIQNPTTFGLYGYYAPEKHYHLIDRYYHNGRGAFIQKSKDEPKKNNVGQMTTKEYCKDLVEWIKSMNYKPEYIALDPSAAPLIVELRKEEYFKRRGIKIIPAKNAVILGIQFLSYLLNIKKFTMYKDSIYDQEEFAAYVWNESRLENGGDEEVVKLNDHCMDSNRYAVMTDSKINRTYEKEVKTMSGKGAL